MRYVVEMRPKATKFLNDVPRCDRERIVKRIGELAENPRNESVIKMSGKNPEQYRARQGDYRILFTICDHRLIVEVIDINTRTNAYKKK